VKARVGQGLQGMSLAAKRISAEVVSELGALHTQLHGSYTSLGHDFNALFEDLLRHINEQRAEADDLREKLHMASELAMRLNADAATKLDQILQEERQQAALERQDLLSQISSLVMEQGEVQDQRLAAKIGDVQKSVLSSKETFEASRSEYRQNMNTWDEKEGKLIERVLQSRDTLTSKLNDDWEVGKLLDSEISLTVCRLPMSVIRLSKPRPDLFTMRLFGSLNCR
jgi:kinesin family protein 11